MRPDIVLFWFLFTTTQQVSCFYNLCHSRKNTFLTDDECSQLFFEPIEKETPLGWIDLRLENDTLLSVTPIGGLWNNAYLRVSVLNHEGRRLCNKLSQGGATKNFCMEFTPDVRNDSFLLEYKAEKLPETSSRKFLMKLPQPDAFIFPYVDQTDTSRLVLKVQKLPSNVNVSYYKVQALKRKHNITRPIEKQSFRDNEDISYEIFTYNDEGEYFFIITALGGNCEDHVCLQVTTPIVYIGRKSTRVVIGIVGASLIFPLVLFLFHILTKKYPIEENSLEEGIMVAYKSSFKKHNDVVVALAALLERLSSNHQIEVVDLSKSTKKFPDKFCIDALNSATRVVYVASPRGDSSAVTVDKAFAQREILALVFDHCTDKLPQSFENCKVFKLFDEFDCLLETLNINSSYEDNALYVHLRGKTEEARIETDGHSRSDSLPKIVVTADAEEPQEHDSLITPEVV